jgi:predicted phage terminase large subunit-like protein
MIQPVLRPQPGFQERFLSSPADITIGGGAAGAGKTYAELLAGARHMMVPGFSAVFFRRTTKQIRNPGGLWDGSTQVYPLLGAVPRVGDLEWEWPSGAKIKMAHLEHESNIHDWQGAQVPLFIFDELVHFTPTMFWYMLSRNRSTCGIKPYIIASCNPDADSWVADLIEWWIDQDQESPGYGFPIPERSGVLRWFTRLNDQLIWGNSREEVCDQVPSLLADQVKSLTFIPGRLEENRILERIDPSYRGNLMAMSRVERARLLDGNWKVRPSAGDYFKRQEVTLIESIPDDVMQWTRRWDLAATEPSESNKDPDWTVGVKMGKRKCGRYVVADAIMFRRRSDEVRRMVRTTAVNDGHAVKVGIPQDPGQAGVDQIRSYTQMLAGYPIIPDRETGDKVTRADPFASQWQAGNVDVLRAPWNAQYFSQMEAFPGKGPGIHDDAVDASSGAFRTLAKGRSSWDIEW